MKALAISCGSLINISPGYPLQVLSRLRFTSPASGLCAAIRQLFNNCNSFELQQPEAVCIFFFALSKKAWHHQPNGSDPFATFEWCLHKFNQLQPQKKVYEINCHYSFIVNHPGHS